ncbi:MAG TPA: molybdopterin-dependent oxidoreductase [Methanocella sp.]|nr:molybdopterin-dependent oxidoreductase [Methanocella sp.]
MKRTNIMVVLFVVLAAFAVAISGCTSPTPTPTEGANVTATPTEAANVTATPNTTANMTASALMINGSVASQQNLTLADLKAMPQNTINASLTNSTGGNETVNGTGVLLNTLLTASNPASNATSVTFIASDGFSNSVNMTDVQAATNATIIINDDGTLRNVIPGQPASTSVSNLTVITIS